MTASSTDSSEFYLHQWQKVLSLPRETLPQLTAQETRRTLHESAAALGLEVIEIESVASSFLLLPSGGHVPRLLLFGTWHAEALPVAPAAVEGAERLALAVSMAALGALGTRELGAVAVPGATQGSLVLAELLRSHRDRLRADSIHWLRIATDAPDRRRIFLGARGRVVLGLWGGTANPYRIRDRIVSELRDEAYGPRPLDFELLHKLASNRGPLDFLEESLDAPESVPGQGEERLRRALFDPRGQVLSPPVPHPDRPRAWIALEITENMEPSDLLERVQRLSPDSEVRMAEGFLWDRVSIHHPAAQAAVKLSKEVSAGPEIWPAAPWVTPSGIFTRELGAPMVEWSIPLSPATAIRFPKPAEFDSIVREAKDLLLRTLEEVAKVSA